MLKFVVHRYYTFLYVNNHHISFVSVSICRFFFSQHCWTSSNTEVEQAITCLILFMSWKPHHIMKASPEMCLRLTKLSFILVLNSSHNIADLMVGCLLEGLPPYLYWYCSHDRRTSQRCPAEVIIKLACMVPVTF